MGRGIHGQGAGVAVEGGELLERGEARDAGGSWVAVF